VLAGADERNEANATALLSFEPAATPE
jgi:hypothetical protein